MDGTRRLCDPPYSGERRGATGTTLVTFAGRVLNVAHPYIQVERLVLDGKYSAADTVIVASTGSFLTLRDVEVRRPARI